MTVPLAMAPGPVGMPMDSAAMSHLQHMQPDVAMPRHILLQPLPRNARLAPEDIPALRGAPCCRLYLALQSGLPNEIDWALAACVRLSSICPDAVAAVLSSLPPLLDSILGFH